MLMFIGRDGYRKGADVAISTHRSLRHSGVRSTLVLIGVDEVTNRKDTLGRRVSPVSLEEGVIAYPFLHRDIAEESYLLSTLYEQSFALLVPSRADCSSIAICDACAYGVPSLAADVGGNSELVGDKVAGVVLPRNASDYLYANIIREWSCNSDSYYRMCASARLRYETLLNWNTSVNMMIRFIKHDAV
jgi:glycosyltransferase involved in cell wall biosynthesis